MPLSEYQEIILHNRRIKPKLEEFSWRRDLDIWAPLRNNTVQLSFMHSWLAEMRCGILFDKFADNLKYDNSIACGDGFQTPDWTFDTNGQLIIAETLRANSQGEFLEQILAADYEAYKINPDHGGFIWKGLRILDPQHYYKHESKITRKELIYRNLVNQYQAPFIICIDPESGTLLSAKDTHEFLIGPYKRGLFYSDTPFARNVAGVLFNKGFGGQFAWFANENAAYPVSEENIMVIQNAIMNDELEYY